MRETIIGKQFDEERALYHLQHTDVENCIFAGPLDGESALKESRDIGLQKCPFISASTSEYSKDKSVSSIVHSTNFKFLQ